jgi:transposase
VSEIAHQLPADIEALHALVTAARAERDAAVAERDQALSQMDRLRHLLRQLQRVQFGRRPEKLDPEQLLLALEDIEQAVAGTTRPSMTKRTPWLHGRAATSAASIAVRFPSAARRCDDRAGRH